MSCSNVAESRAGGLHSTYTLTKYLQHYFLIHVEDTGILYSNERIQPGKVLKPGPFA